MPAMGRRLDGIGTLGMGQEANEQDYEEKWRHLDAALRSLDVTPGRMLDAGCGIGWFTERLVDVGFDPVAFDFSETAIGLTRQRLGDDVDLTVSSVTDFVADRPFPLVVCIDVLFHIVDDERWRAGASNLMSLVEPGAIWSSRIISSTSPTKWSIPRPGTPAGDRWTCTRTRSINSN